MFNVSGGEIVVILLLALVILGPEKLPEALRRAGRTYAELKKMGNSFQTEMRSVLDEPMKEMRDTADLLRQAVDVTVETATTDTRAPAQPRPVTATPDTPPAPAVDEPATVPAEAASVVEPPPALDTSDTDTPATATPETARTEQLVEASPVPAPAPPEVVAPVAEPVVAERVSSPPSKDDLINRTLAGDP